CQFINAPQVVLTTGIPKLDAMGNLDSYRVKQGDIVIDGKGLTANNAVLSILTRALKVNARVHAGDIRAFLGRAKISAKFDQWAPFNLGRDVEPGYALDIGSMGGMYANRIHLLATEKGLGVNSQGELLAGKGAIVLRNFGVTTLGGTIEADAVFLGTQE